MQQIDAINIILAAIGEARVVDDMSPNPTVGLALQSLDTRRRALLETGWWFNVLNITLHPDREGYIDVPYNCIEIYSPDGIYQRRGNRLFDLETYSYKHTSPKKLKITLDMDIQDIPESAAQYITYSAAAELYSNDLGADKSFESLRTEASIAYTMLQRNQLRHAKYSTRKSPRYQRILSTLTN